MSVDLSALGEVRRRRDELLAKRAALTLPLPTWSGELAARYRVLHERDAALIAHTLNATNGRSEESVGDVPLFLRILADACTGVLVRNGDGELHPVERDGDPVRFDKRLAEAMGFEAASSPDVVRALFSDEHGELVVGALTTHVRTVTEWMNDPTRSVEGELLGES